MNRDERYRNKTTKQVFTLKKDYLGWYLQSGGIFRTPSAAETTMENALTHLYEKVEDE